MVASLTGKKVQSKCPPVGVLETPFLDLSHWLELGHLTPPIGRQRKYRYRWPCLTQTWNYRHKCIKRARPSCKSLSAPSVWDALQPTSDGRAVGCFLLVSIGMVLWTLGDFSLWLSSWSPAATHTLWIRGIRMLRPEDLRSISNNPQTRF